MSNNANKWPDEYIFLLRKLNSVSPYNYYYDIDNNKLLTQMQVDKLDPIKYRFSTTSFLVGKKETINKLYKLINTKTNIQNHFESIHNNIYALIDLYNKKSIKENKAKSPVKENKIKSPVKENIKSPAKEKIKSPAKENEVKSLKGKNEEKEVNDKKDIKLVEYEKFYGLEGKGTLYYKNELPTNSNKKPKYSKKYGWMYFKNDENLKKLNDFLEKVKNSKTNLTDAPLDKKYGIIGWDVPYKQSEWLTKITGDKWDPLLNPKINMDKTWIFQKCAVSKTAVSKAFKYLIKQKKDDEYVWDLLYPNELMLDKEYSLVQPDWNDFMTGDYVSAAAGWGKHARFVYKDIKNQILYVFDPWKTNIASTSAFRKLKEQIKSSYNYSTQFVVRKPDQGQEGSCNVIAPLRAILLAEYGIVGATMDIPYDYAVLVSRIISKFR